MNLREFVDKLDKRGLLVRIKRPVDVKYEMATLMKMLDGKPVLFEQAKGSSMPVVANICSSRELIALGLGIEQDEIISKLTEAVDHPKEPKVVDGKDYEEIDVDLTKLPILIHYSLDGGPYISSSIVVAKNPEFGLNASYHRMMVIGKDKVVIRILPRHFDEFLKRGDREFAICIGNPMPVLVASAVSAELGKSELSIANALAETNLIELGGHRVPESEIIMITEMTDEMHDEGPFLDLTETPDIVRKQRVAKIKKIFVKKNPIYQALLPGALQHKFLMGMPREPSIFREVI